LQKGCHQQQVLLLGKTLSSKVKVLKNRVGIKKKQQQKKEFFWWIV
jgi:hypothetical protein